MGILYSEGVIHMTQMDDRHTLMTVAQAARHAGMSRQRINEFITEGRLPVVVVDKLTKGARTHNKYLIRKSTLDNFLATGVKPVGRPPVAAQPEPDSPVED